jgi:hypothetical protein
MITTPPIESHSFFGYTLSAAVCTGISVAASQGILSGIGAFGAIVFGLSAVRSAFFDVSRELAYRSDAQPGSPESPKVTSTHPAPI